VVHQAVDALEKMWLENSGIAQDFHDDAVSARGLAFLLENKPREAMRELSRGARHAVNLRRNEDRVLTLKGDAPGEETAGRHKRHQRRERRTVARRAKTAEADVLNNLALAEAGQARSIRPSPASRPRSARTRPSAGSQ
jgi:hypothetical protein